MNKKRQAGFSLLELLVAMMILAVIATLGFKQLQKNTAKAHHLKAVYAMKATAEALDQYYIKHGYYPEFTSYDAMVDNGSVLVKESHLQHGHPAKDPWGQAYEARSSKKTYYLKCLGDPSNPDDPDLGWFSREPNRLAGAGSENTDQQQGGAPPAADGAGK